MHNKYPVQKTMQEYLSSPLSNMFIIALDRYGEQNPSLKRVPIAYYDPPEVVCGIVLRIGYIMTAHHEELFYRLKLKRHFARNPARTMLPGFFVLSNALFVPYQPTTSSSSLLTPFIPAEKNQDLL